MVVPLWDLLGYLAVGFLVISAVAGSLALLAVPSGRARRRPSESASSHEGMARPRTTAPPGGADPTPPGAPAGDADQAGPGDLTWGGVALCALLVLGSTEPGVQLAAGLLIVLVPATSVLVAGCAYRHTQR